MVALFDFVPLPIDENGKGIQGTYRNLGSGHGTVTTAGTAVPLSNVQTQAKIIDIINTNTATGDYLIIGNSTVKYSTSNGVPIPPGATYRLNITDLSLVYIDSQNNSDTFSFNYFW